MGSAFPSEPPVHAFDSRAQAFITPLARRRPSCPPPSPNLVLTRPIKRTMIRLRVCGGTLLGFPRQGQLPLACRTSSRSAPNWRSGRGAPCRYHPQPTKPPRRVSTDRLNRVDSQLVAHLKAESGPTPAGKTLPHSSPRTRFRRERERVRIREFSS